MAYINVEQYVPKEFYNTFNNILVFLKDVR